MRAIAAVTSLGILLAAAAIGAQNNPQNQVVASTQRAPEATSPDYSAVYCSDFITEQKVPEDTRLISGEESNVNVAFVRGDYIYLSKGSNQGVHVGDRYSFVRPVADPTKVPWFKWQEKLMKAMGTLYEDTGQAQVINVHPNVSVAQVSFSCDYMQRGDIARPFQERPSPPYKPASKFDQFAPPSGKAVGMVVDGRQFAQLYGKYSTVYVNLGNGQGVNVGDYIRIFRYQGTNDETVPNTEGYQYQLYGFGSTPQRYTPKDLPRDVIGEGIVINESRNSATVLITYSRIDIYAGDYAELE
jgi:hypothetical protein